MALCNTVAFPSRKHLEAEIDHKELQMKARLRKCQQYFAQLEVIYKKFARYCNFNNRKDLSAAQIVVSLKEGKDGNVWLFNLLPSLYHLHPLQ